MDLIGATGVVITCRFHRRPLPSTAGFVWTAQLSHVYSDQRGIFCLFFKSWKILSTAEVLACNNRFSALNVEMQSVFGGGQEAALVTVRTAQ